ncbi:MAG: PadR family transcriptional regulator [Propionibacteriales bacterium]|nr:PadR family transcriptional regulator [Propionibacteriales bacterium]
MHASTALPWTVEAWWPRWHRLAMAAAGRRTGPFGPGHRHPHAFGRGGMHFGPPWMGRGGPRVGRGDVRAAVLLLVEERPMHGYQIIREITERSDGVWRPSPGSVYPTLQQLEDEGLVTVEKVGGRRMMELTDEGRVYVDEHRDRLGVPWETASGGVPDDLLGLRDLAAQVAAALMQVGREGTPAQREEARKALVGVRKRLYQILAEDEPD